MLGGENGRLLAAGTAAAGASRPNLPNRSCEGPMEGGLFVEARAFKDDEEMPSSALPKTLPLADRFALPKEVLS